MLKNWDYISGLFYHNVQYSIGVQLIKYFSAKHKTFTKLLKNEWDPLENCRKLTFYHLYCFQ